jgi:hypothetical protein
MSKRSCVVDDLTLPMVRSRRLANHPGGRGFYISSVAQWVAKTGFWWYTSYGGQEAVVMTKSAKVAKPRKKQNKKESAALATCPVGSSGWCSYPFSVTQLQKRLRRIADGGKTAEEMATVGPKTLVR